MNRIKISSIEVALLILVTLLSVQLTIITIIVSAILATMP